MPRALQRGVSKQNGLIFIYAMYMCLGDLQKKMDAQISLILVCRSIKKNVFTTRALRAKPQVSYLNIMWFEAHSAPLDPSTRIICVPLTHAPRTPSAPPETPQSSVRWLPPLLLGPERAQKHGRTEGVPLHHLRHLLRRRCLWPQHITSCFIMLNLTLARKNFLTVDGKILYSRITQMLHYICFHGDEATGTVCLRCTYRSCHLEYKAHPN